MLKAFPSFGNLNRSNSLFKEYLKLKLCYAKGFSVQRSSRLATVAESKRGLLKHGHVLSSQLSDDRGYRFQISNSSNGAVRFKSDVRDTNHDEIRVSSVALEPIGISKGKILDQIILMFAIN